MSQTQSHSPPAQLLDSFWKLSEYSGASRLTGTRQLVSYYSEHARTDAA